MTRDEFMAYAESEVDEIVGRQKNRIMNVVSRAWAEGKRRQRSRVSARSSRPLWSNEEVMPDE